MIRRFNILDMLTGDRTGRGRFWLDAHLNDTPRTIRAVILALPRNCVGVTVHYSVGRAGRAAAQAAAREKGIRLRFSRLYLGEV